MTRLDTQKYHEVFWLYQTLPRDHVHAMTVRETIHNRLISEIELSHQN